MNDDTSTQEITDAFIQLPKDEFLAAYEITVEEYDYYKRLMAARHREEVVSEFLAKVLDNLLLLIAIIVVAVFAFH